MNQRVNIENIKQYQGIFGLVKMKNLWKEFVDDAKDKLSGIENKSSEQQRLNYHSLRSSSLIFGMQEFSELCHQYEEKILSGIDLLDDEIDESRKLLIETILEVNTYLK